LGRARRAAGTQRQCFCGGRGVSARHRPGVGPRGARVPAKAARGTLSVPEGERMKSGKALLGLLLSVVMDLCAAQTPPEWAYPVNPPGFKPHADDGTLRHVPGSTASYTLTQLRDRFLSPVWHPE